MTDNYPEWQEPLRKAQKVEQDRINEQVAKDEEETRVKREKRLAIESAYLLSLGLPATDIVQENNEWYHKIGGYLFSIYQGYYSRTLRVEPLLDADTKTLFEETEVSWFSLVPNYLWYSGQLDVVGRETLEPRNSTIEQAQSALADLIDAVDEAVKQAKEQALAIKARPPQEPKYISVPKTHASLLIEQLRLVIDEQIDQALADRGL